MTQHDDFEICQIIPRDVTFRDRKVSFGFKELSAGDAEDLFSPFTIEDEDKKREAMKGLRDRIIAKVVRRSDGSEFTPEQARSLPNPVANEFQKLAMEVNGLSGEEKKSKAANDSGTSSPDDSDPPSPS